jgi:hypothetical protein
MSVAYIEANEIPIRVLMEKSSGNHCPKCLRDSLNVYYDEESGFRLGAVCQLCGLKGYFTEGRLMVMAAP